MTILILTAAGALIASVAIASTIAITVRDGYGPVPDRHAGLRHR